MEPQGNRPAHELLDSGELIFRVRRGDAEAEFTLDLLELKLTCEEAVAAHSLAEDKTGRYVPTAAFLRDLAGRLEGLGVCGCTPTLACKFWHAAGEEWERLKNGQSETPS